MNIRGSISFGLNHDDSTTPSLKDHILETVTDMLARMKRGMRIKLLLFSESWGPKSSPTSRSKMPALQMEKSAIDSSAVISHRELFFDLIFVVVCVEVSVPFHVDIVQLRVMVNKA